MHYAQWYRQLYDLPPTDRPEERVIQDDDELDRWWDHFLREKDREWAQLANKQGKSSSAGWKSPEQAVKKYAPKMERQDDKGESKVQTHPVTPVPSRTRKRRKDQQ